MLIGIDGRPFYGPQAGTGRYVAELCRALDRALPEASFLVYGNRALQLPVANARWAHRRDDFALASRFPSSLWYFLCVARLVRQDGVDVFWGAANFLPAGLGEETRAVLTLHDFVHELFPETLSVRHRLAYLLFFKASLERAQLVASNSQGTAARLAALHGRDADVVVRPRASQDFSAPHPGIVVEVLRRCRIDFPYYLSVATLEPRKNLENLIEAFLQMREAGELPGAGLVLVGQAGWKNGRLAERVAAARAAGVPIVLTGYVPDDWLPSLYAGAVAVVAPSLYEGFGMPVLEAKCCGATVVASDIPEIREAGGDGPIYVEPTIEGLKHGLRQAGRTSPAPAGDAAAVDRGESWSEEGQKLANEIRRLG